MPQFLHQSAGLYFGFRVLITGICSSKSIEVNSTFRPCSERVRRPSQKWRLYRTPETKRNRGHSTKRHGVRQWRWRSKKKKKRGGNQSKRRPVQRLTNTLKVKALPPFAIVFASDLQTPVPIVTIHLTHQQP